MVRAIQGAGRTREATRGRPSPAPRNDQRGPGSTRKGRTTFSGTIRREIGPVAAFKEVRVVPALPKTRSGKILRKTMRSIADGRDVPTPSTIEDPAVLDAIGPVLRRG